MYIMISVSPLVLTELIIVIVIVISSSIHCIIPTYVTSNEMWTKRWVTEI